MKLGPGDNHAAYVKQMKLAVECLLKHGEEDHALNVSAYVTLSDNAITALNNTIEILEKALAEECL